MAGLFGDQINSRADFFVQLRLARAACSSLRKRLPEEGVLASVEGQLEAIAAWTKGGEVPDADDRRQIRMGYEMHRAFEMSDDLEIYRFSQQISGLSNYVRAWPDDATAADDSNAEYVPYEK